MQSNHCCASVVPLKVAGLSDKCSHRGKMHTYQYSSTRSTDIASAIELRCPVPSDRRLKTIIMSVSFVGGDRNALKYAPKYWTAGYRVSHETQDTDQLRALKWTPMQTGDMRATNIE